MSSIGVSLVSGIKIKTNAEKRERMPHNVVGIHQIFFPCKNTKLLETKYVRKAKLKINVRPFGIIKVKIIYIYN